MEWFQLVCHPFYFRYRFKPDPPLTLFWDGANIKKNKKKGSCGRKLNGLVTKGHRWPWRAIIIRTLAYRTQTGVFDWPEWCDEFFPFSFFAAAGAIKSLRRRSLLTDKKRGISDGSALQSGGGKWYSSEMKRGAERDFDFFFLFTPMLLPLLSK